MTALAKNKWYQLYLKEVSSGNLILPSYTTENGQIKLYYGEKFCRVPDCAKAQKEYSATNNLRTHILSHEDYDFAENSGGRVGTKIVDEATRWYKNLFAVTSANSSVVASSPHRPNDYGQPKLPLRKDGTVHVTNMRLKVVEMGLQVPCNSCKVKKDCCKDINKCDHFWRFDCGTLRPTHSSSTAEAITEEAV